MRPGRPWVYGAAITLLMVVAVGVQVVRGRTYGDTALDDRLLYLRSGTVAAKAALSFDTLLADVYWIRALQHFGNDRLRPNIPGRFELLYPLLDLTTTLDPDFVVAYRFGAIFLSEPDPGGASRPDLAIALLKKGVRTTNRWEYYYDIGFVYYWNLHDYTNAADWFRRGGDLPGAPWWLRTYAAVMLTKGGDRQASRFLWQEVLQRPDTNEWLRNTAQMRLLQLDALDQIDILRRAVSEFQRRTGKLPERWRQLVAAGLLRGEPVDPSGTPYTLNFATGEVNVSGYSPLHPLPTEPR
ncbi:MAG: hypothetical protein ND807_14285 [Vicinamibacterales bacterium]|nr:hypothetical protein [Vicinamibacterales bacterium]